jgi:hypothetical protein
MSLCACGCGGETPLHQRTNARLGHVMGQPCRYRPAHNGGRPGGKLPSPERLKRRAAAQRRRRQLVRPLRAWTHRPVIPKCPGCGMRAYHATDYDCSRATSLSVAATTRKQKKAAWDAWVCPPCPLPGPGH